jgi:hypothetical protein
VSDATTTRWSKEYFIVWAIFILAIAVWLGVSALLPAINNGKGNSNGGVSNYCDASCHREIQQERNDEWYNSP